MLCGGGGGLDFCGWEAGLEAGCGLLPGCEGGLPPLLPFWYSALGDVFPFCWLFEFGGEKGRNPGFD